jgi:iron complex transport system permease protein
LKKSIRIRSGQAGGTYKWPLLVLLLILFSLISLLLGPVNVTVVDIFSYLTGSAGLDPTVAGVLSDFRIPRVLTALLAGAALSVSGLQMQTVFRNPLAGPYVLGITSGASLGVAILILGFNVLFPGGLLPVWADWSMAIVAWIGSGLVLMVIFLVTLRIRDIMTILILGMLLGSATGAVVNILQYFSNEALLKTYVIWTMGSLGGVTSAQLTVMVPVILAGLILSVMSGKMLNTLLLGENYARSLGLNITMARLTIFFSTSLLAGTVTAFCGPIGFIGIAIPHIAKLLFRTANHFLLIPGCILIGGLLLIISDIIAQLPGYSSVLPINSVTALIGIPVVVYVIFRNQRLSFGA